MSAVSRAIKAHANKLEDELMTAAFNMRSNRMQAAARIRDLENDLAEAREALAAYRHGPPAESQQLRGALDALAEARAWADSMLRKIEVLEAQVAVKDTALSAIVAQYAKRAYGGEIVAADEQYPWIAQAMRALRLSTTTTTTAKMEK